MVQSETTKPSRRHRWTEEVQEGSTQLAPRPVWKDTDLIHLHSVGRSVGYPWGLQLFGKWHIIHPAMEVQVLPAAATLCVVRNLSGDKGSSTPSRVGQHPAAWGGQAQNTFYR